MATATTIDSVVTEDAVPAVAPHRISRDAAHNLVTVKFTPTHDGSLTPGPTTYPSDGSIFPASTDAAAGPFPDDPTFYPDDGALILGVAQDLIGYVVREGGTDSTTGKLIAVAGSVCSASLPCSARRPCSEWGYRIPSGTQVTKAITFADADDGGADGARTINVYVLTDNQGWS